MKVLLFNSSSHKEGCTFTALSIVADELNKEGIETEIIQLGSGAIRDCIGCGACRKLDNQCIFKDDIVNEILDKAKRCRRICIWFSCLLCTPERKIIIFNG